MVNYFVFAFGCCFFVGGACWLGQWLGMNHRRVRPAFVAAAIITYALVVVFHLLPALVDRWLPGVAP